MRQFANRLCSTTLITWLACALLGVTTVSAQSVSFGAARSFAVGARPSGTAAGDFNRDGIADLIAVNADNTFSYLQGVGDGTFRAAASFSMAALTADLPGPITVGDFNGDGNLDLAIAHPTPTGMSGGNTVTVHLGDGRGGFASPGVVFNTGGSNTGIANGDFNGDGKLDLAVASCASGAIFIFSGNGDGTFLPTALFPAGACSAGLFVATVDVNKDGKLDLLVSNASDNSVSVLLGDGTGRFGAPARIAVAGNPGAIATGDFNRDGNVDIAVANFSGNSVTILPGDGRGGFTVGASFPAVSVPTDVLAADFDRNGILDLLVVNSVSSSVSVLLGDGGGRFPSRFDFPAGGSPLRATVADLNGDSLPDFAVTNNLASGTVQVLLNASGVGVSVSPPTVVLTAGQSQQFTATVTNSANTAVTWSIDPIVGFISNAGLYIAPSVVPVAQTVTVRATSQADPTRFATATVNLSTSITVTVNPSATALTAGQFQQFTATVANTSNTAVTWSINPNVGAISTTGLYTAPASITATQTVTVTATSMADVTKSGSATVTLVPPGTSTGNPIWNQLAPQGALPAPRGGRGSSAVFDPVTNRMIVFGGRGPSGVLNDVWVLTSPFGTAGTPQWINLLADGMPGSPPAREGHTALYDPATNRMIIFGGCGPNCTPAFNDAWVLINANGLGGPPAWFPLSPQGTPPAARVGHTAVYDPSTNRMIIFGGQNVSSVAPLTFSDTWLLTNANGLGGTPVWIQLSTVNGPPPGQNGASAVYDAATNRMIVFGGTTQTTAAETNAVWLLANANGFGGIPTWLNLISEGRIGAPPARHNHSAVYDAAANQMMIFAGQTSAIRLNDVWVLSGANGAGAASSWAQLTPIGGPPTPRDVSKAVFDSSSKRMTIFGGNESSGALLNDVWVLAPSAAVTVAVTPATVTLTASQTQQFTATVSNTTNTAVTWTISPNVGTISATGLYTAPATISAAQTVTVTATSAADPSKLASATVNLAPAVVVTISPASVTLTASQTQQFTATVSNTTNTAVTWSLNPNIGAISATGLYTAPASIPVPETVTVIATSVADPSKSASATLSLAPQVSVILSPSTATLTAGQTQQFTVTVLNTTNTNVTWSINPNVGTISATGLYTAPSTIAAPQFVTVTATSVADASRSGSALISLSVPAPIITAGGIVHGATTLPGPIAPGEVVVIFGVGIGPPTLVRARLNAAGLLDSSIGDTRILFDGIPAPMVFARFDQASAVVPYSVAGRTSTQVQVEFQGVKSNPATVPVVPASPGIFSLNFTGTGPGAILNQDNITVNSAATPAPKGSIVVIFATGEGQTNPPGIDGKLAAPPLPQPILPVRVFIGGVEAEVLYKGGAPGLVAGVLQVNARVPDQVASGPAVPVVLTVGSASSPPGITLAVQ